jgi:hypothetical protein
MLRRRLCPRPCREGPGSIQRHRRRAKCRQRVRGHRARANHGQGGRKIEDLSKAFRDTHAGDRAHLPPILARSFGRRYTGQILDRLGAFLHDRDVRSLSGSLVLDCVLSIVNLLRVAARVGLLGRGRERAPWSRLQSFDSGRLAKRTDFPMLGAPHAGSHDLVCVGV